MREWLLGIRYEKSGAEKREREEEEEADDEMMEMRRSRSNESSESRGKDTNARWTREGDGNKAELECVIDRMAGIRRGREQRRPPATRAGRTTADPLLIHTYTYTYTQATRATAATASGQTATANTEITSCFLTFPRFDHNLSLPLSLPLVCQSNPPLF